jgi:ribosome-binding factor A
MPINRNAEHHRDRVIEALKDEISTMLEGDLSDPRIGLCTLTDVIMAPGGKSARVLVQVDGPEEDVKQTMEALQDARSYIRNTVRESLGKRHIPELTFHLDQSAMASSRIEELLERMKKREKPQK